MWKQVPGFRDIVASFLGLFHERNSDSLVTQGLFWHGGVFGEFGSAVVLLASAWKIAFFKFMRLNFWRTFGFQVAILRNKKDDICMRNWTKTRHGNEKKKSSPTHMMKFGPFVGD